MKSPSPSPVPPSPESLKAIPYDDTTAAKPPIPISGAFLMPQVQQNGNVESRQPKSSNQRLSPHTARSKIQDDGRRDSGLAPSASTARDSHTTFGTDGDSTFSVRHSPSIPSSTTHDDTVCSQNPAIEDGKPQLSANHQDEVPEIPRSQFMGLMTEIPTGSFEDLTIPGQIQFSKRGSMLIGGRKANNANDVSQSNGYVVGSRRKPNHSLLAPSKMPTRILSTDEEALSHKVRSMYEGRREEISDLAVDSKSRMKDGRIDEEPRDLRSPSHSNGIPEIITNHVSPPQASSHASSTNNGLTREDSELAGGMEDWDNIHSEDVDRYGFIIPHKFTSQTSSLHSSHANSPEIPRIQRVSTLVQLASEAPRRRRSNLRTPARSPARSVETPASSRPDSSIMRPTSSQSSYRTINGKESRLRSAANRLPHNKDRRCVDEAGDMLTLPPGLADIAEDEEDSKVADSLKRQEWEREEKWRKMAKIVKTEKLGGGMIFEFDTRSPKLIERTWKGIPDRWRATAWHAFLTASAKKRQGSLSDDELIAVFQKLVNQGSPDDVQIDIDVPRTINSHIMFRRRYRGGQRLLFRVLHCLSIYFPDTGYVQGMAALAATLLCYFDEEMTFVMLVRLWQLRGLERLYKSGFEGLMQALEEFERDWLSSSEVAAKLTEMNITPTAYGTRWYLTLFNYSIPFPAQLRIWDVFMLLGDPSPPPLPSSTSSHHNPQQPSSIITSSTSSNAQSFHGGLDVLHAASAALIDGTREILLESDFENAMKVLTGWIPVKDEGMMMRVARVEWKMRRRRWH